MPYVTLSDCGYLVLQVALLVQMFGAERLLWGTDYPFVEAECGYRNAKAAAEAGVSKADMQKMMGGTATKLFGVWQ
jgi:predicted TIM-barrel fold metal-dependent hydrolase